MTQFCIIFGLFFVMLSMWKEKAEFPLDAMQSVHYMLVLTGAMMIMMILLSIVKFWSAFVQAAGILLS